MWPTFSVTEILPCGNPVGAIDFLTVGKKTWVSDRSIGYLKLDDSLLFGNWHTHDRGWRFAPKSVATFAVGNEYSVIDGYWGERVLIATDPNLKWSPAVWTNTNDHDHCAICWATISTLAESNHYKNQTPDSVCASCYQQHVSQRDISFVPVE